MGPGMAGEEYYRDRWHHDKVVRSTHGVNCGGSCSWDIFVRDGLITGEQPAGDYPQTGPGCPDYEPRGCPRGAVSSSYSYNSGRIKHPYARGVLLELWRRARQTYDDPVEAWASIARDPGKTALYVASRGHGGFVRISWDEALEICAAAHVFTIKEYGPDRVAGFSPAPAASIVSQAAGSRYLSLTGGAQLSYYDWHGDLPPAFPQAFGDQTDSPESADWWNAGFLMLWGTNLPQTRTPDAHFMVEARYKGQKVVAVSPDYAEHVRFADRWLQVRPGQDAALAMAMGHVIFKEFFVDRQVPYFVEYVRTYTDMPFLVSLAEHGGHHVPDRFLTAADLGDQKAEAIWMPLVFDERTSQPSAPNGTQGFRWAEAGEGRWNLDLGDISPALSLLGLSDKQVDLALPRFDAETPVIMHRSVPALKIKGHLVTTVFDLLLAQCGVQRGETLGEWPRGYDDSHEPFTPAWQERLTGISGAAVAATAREFARNAELTRGRSMIATGAGLSHWHHSDLAYRAITTVLAACGCIGRNGGGLAHYSSQQKVAPLAGWAMVSTARDWVSAARQVSATTWFYLASDQWRYETRMAGEDESPLAKGLLKDLAPADALVKAARLGWQVPQPAFDRNPLKLATDAAAAYREGMYLNDYLAGQLRDGRLRSAAEDPDGPPNWPRVLFVWRADLLGNSAQGHGYLLRHLLGAGEDGLSAEEAPEGRRPRDVVWRESAPVGKLDLLVDLDFRLTTTAAFADILLPAAGWYEKCDLCSTDMHPFINCLNAVIAPPWEARTDWDAFRELARKFSRLAESHLGILEDLVAMALGRDTPAEASQPLGRVRDWHDSGAAAIPGQTMPHVVVVRRDFPAVYSMYTTLGPRADDVGCSAKGLGWDVVPEVEMLRTITGTAGGGAGAGRPLLEDDRQVIEAILALSGSTNRRAAFAGFEALGKRVGRDSCDRACGDPGQRITWADVQARPQRVYGSAEWSGEESADRSYSPFSRNVERLVPWRTLTGRIQLAIDHEWFSELGEFLPGYRPPLKSGDLRSGQLQSGEPGVMLRYLTPHSKWSINSTYSDDPLLLTLFRGGPGVWLSPDDASTIGVRDNERVEMRNRNGRMVCLVVVSPRIPRGVCYLYQGATPNFLTRIVLKPTHLVGGYAQLSFAPNYYGCTGAQRDEQVTVRRYPDGPEGDLT
ncbi:MAG: nitrate reductase subunit alpha [Actinobacteria bacterium]|nr:nitrate reductase subunit alpha [Actinomycetota bacterium]